MAGYGVEGMGCQNLDNLSYKTFISTETVLSTEVHGSVQERIQLVYQGPYKLFHFLNKFQMYMLIYS